LAKLVYKYLVKNDYADNEDRITAVHTTTPRSAGTLAALPPELQPYAEQVFQLIDSVFSEAAAARDRRRPPAEEEPAQRQLRQAGVQGPVEPHQPQGGLQRASTPQSWSRRPCHGAEPKTWPDVTPCSTPSSVASRLMPTYDGIKSGEGFVLKATETEVNRQHSVHSAVKYDLIGKLAEGTQLTRRTVVEILKGMNVAVFAQFKTNPESFIAEAIRLINEQKATVIIEHLAYDPVEDKFDLDIFTAGLTKQDFSKAGDKLQRHIYDYVLTDSNRAPFRQGTGHQQ
jgi:type III restriction enzyme